MKEAARIVGSFSHQTLTIQTGVDIHKYAHLVEYRELGGAMSSMWASYIAQADRVLLVLDSSSPARIGEGLGLLLTIMAQASITTPVGLVANKRDLEAAVPVWQLACLLGQQVLERVTTFDTCALSGDGLPAIKNWVCPPSSCGEGL